VKKLYITLSLLVIILLSLLIPVAANQNFTEHKIGYFYQVYNENNKKLFSTAMKVSVGDRYISQENIEYKIIEVNNYKAIAERVGKVNLKESFAKKSVVSQRVEAAQKPVVAIYHTHNAESYLPGDFSTYGHGEIHSVGESFVAALKKNGIQPIQSDNLHLPHDGGAYTRSQATAINLLAKNPTAIFDIHRDGIPNKREYLENVNGRQISQIRLVVGRQNPNQEANDKFARQLKAISDQNYPGLIRDIFYGGGAYNQQFSPHSLLLEFGTYVTSQDLAEKSAQMMAVVVADLFKRQTDHMKEDISNSSLQTAFNLILFTLGVLLLYFYLTTGSIAGVKERIKDAYHGNFLDQIKDKDQK